jgi:hypothetical protein
MVRIVELEKGHPKMHRNGLITLDHDCGQGAGRFESGAIFIGGEHFERSATPPPDVKRGDETTSNCPAGGSGS